MRYELGTDVGFSIDARRVSDHSGDITDGVRRFIGQRLEYFFGEYQTTEDAPVQIDLSTWNPLFDESLLASVVRIARKHNRSVTIQGAVPGTEPLAIRVRSEAPPFLFMSSQQSRWNSQLNLAKLKRVKIFLALQRHFPRLCEMPLDSILEFCGSSDGVELILSFGEDVTFDRYDSCPLCGNTDAQPLQCDVGQPRVGFFTRHSIYYWHCGVCGLVYLNPSPKAEHLHKYYDWYDKEMLAPRAEVEAIRSEYIANYDRCLDRFAPDLPPGARVLDLGGGQGAFSVRAKQRRPDWEVSIVDFECNTADYLQRQFGILAKSGNFVDDDLGHEQYDLITLWEVFEHIKLDRLQRVVTSIARALKPGGHVAFSTPDFASPVTRLGDFWATFAPQHMSVLSMQAMAPLWEAAGLELVGVAHEALLTSKGYGEMKYLSTAGGSIASRAAAEVLGRLLNAEPVGDAIRSELLHKQNMGVEMVVTLRKKQHQTT